MTFLTRFDPFDDVNTLKSRIERTLARLTPESEGELFAAQWAPVTDVLETKDALLINTELPGLTEKEIKVQVEGGVLTISGERSVDKKVEEDNFRRIERSYGKFVRRFTLPPDVDGEKIAAAFNNGLLEVQIPKKESAKPRTVAVEVKKKLTAAA
jgi:HSP20 family protein